MDIEASASLNNGLHTSNFTLEPANNRRLAMLCGECDEHIRQIEQRLDVSIKNRGTQFSVTGSENAVQATQAVLGQLYQETERHAINAEHVHMALQDANIESIAQPSLDADEHHGQPTVPKAAQTASKMESRSTIKTKKKLIKLRGANQHRYIERVASHDVSFGIGPAGTGKTYLAVACAVEALERQEVRRIVLTRPAVEAGERLGFLPGDLNQKVDPYLRPLYDALYEMLGFDHVAKLLERNIIEIAPLAYMRGRTLNDSFIILDESQNTTKEQMKMFLTRVGFNSKVVITGDVTQIDLPRGQYSGLRAVINILQEVEGISFTFFGSGDVVRHPVVQRIVQAYERFEQTNDE
tara:strand:- start:1852 stop:2910 length:1059 start_codon:yes stop_codon:yes gene_type:complete